jgi:hypothetical protein
MTGKEQTNVLAKFRTGYEHLKDAARQGRSEQLQTITS